MWEVNYLNCRKVIGDCGPLLLRCREIVRYQHVIVLSGMTKS
jgi:hypothetical protein